MNLSDTYTLTSGVKIPVIGFGTWQTPSGDAEDIVKIALENGYRHY
jgi:diketogulonate reductase-like aldo/keto reductase